MKLNTVFIFFILMTSICPVHSQNREHSNLTSNWKSTKVGTTDLFISFIEIPYQTQKSNEILDQYSYRCLGKNNASDPNLMYYISVIQYKQKTIIDNQKLMTMTNMVVDGSYKDQLISSVLKENTLFRNINAIKSKATFLIDGNKTCFTSLSLSYDNQFIHMFVLSPPDKEENQYINAFFDSLILSNNK